MGTVAASFARNTSASAAEAPVFSVPWLPPSSPAPRDVPTGAGRELLNPGGPLSRLIVSFLHPGDAEAARMLLPAMGAAPFIDPEHFLIYHLQSANYDMLRFYPRFTWVGFPDIYDRAAARGWAALMEAIPRCNLAYAQAEGERVRERRRRGARDRYGSRRSYLAGVREEKHRLVKKWTYDRALATAAANGHVKCMEAAIKHGATTRHSPTEEAAAKGHVAALECMRAHGRLGGLRVRKNALKSAFGGGKHECALVIQRMGEVSLSCGWEYVGAVTDAARGGSAECLHMAIRLDVSEGRQWERLIDSDMKQRVVDAATASGDKETAEVARAFAAGGRQIFVRGDRVGAAGARHGNAIPMIVLDDGGEPTFSSH